MKDVNLVLREKELDIVRRREEIEALHLAIPLLAEDQDCVEHGLTCRLPHSPNGLELLIDDGRRLLALAVTLRSRALF